MSTTNLVVTANAPILDGLAALESTSISGVNGQQLQRDTWDLLGSLALAVRPRLCKIKLIRTYPDSFYGHEALNNLTSLKFIRSPNSDNPSNVTPRTVATLRLAPHEGKFLLHNFFDARLIRDSANNAMFTIPTASKHGVYSFTDKGLRVIQDFIERNAIEEEADHLIATLAKLLMPRPAFIQVKQIPGTRDQASISQNAVYNLFRNLCGPQPNYSLPNKGVRLLPAFSSKKLLQPYLKNASHPLRNIVTDMESAHCIEVHKMVYWLLMFTTLNSTVEAVEIGAQFVRFGLISFVNAGKGDTARETHTTKGLQSALNPVISQEASFVFVMDTVYVVTDEGRRVLCWDTYFKGATENILEINPAQLNYNKIFDKRLDERQSANANRLKTWLQQPTMRSKFSSFMREDGFDYLLPFYFDAGDFRAACNDCTDFGVPVAQLIPDIPAVGSSRMAAEHAATEQVLREQSHEPLSNRPFLIYNTYLASTSRYGLRNVIGEDLVKETDTLLAEILEIVTNRALVADVNPFQESATLEMGHLQIISELYGRIQDRAFKTMVLEYVPQFMKSDQFLNFRGLTQSSRTV